MMSHEFPGRIDLLQNVHDLFLMAHVSDDHDLLCLGVGKHISQQGLKFRLPRFGHICSAEALFNVNPIAVPIHIRSDCFQFSADQSAISTGITGGIEDLDGCVVKSDWRDPFGAVPDIPISWRYERRRGCWERSIP